MESTTTRSACFLTLAQVETLRVLAVTSLQKDLRLCGLVTLSKTWTN